MTLSLHTVEDDHHELVRDGRPVGVLKVPRELAERIVGLLALADWIEVRGRTVEIDAGQGGFVVLELTAAQQTVEVEHAHTLDAVIARVLERLDEPPPPRPPLRIVKP